MTKPTFVSERGSRLPASPIRRLHPLAVAARARGTHIFGLNIGQPDLPAPASFMQTLHAYESDDLQYSPSAGDEDCHKAWLAYYESVGFPLEPSQALVTTGGSEALNFTFQVVADPGDQILTPEPFYTNYQTFALTAGVELVPIPTRAEDGYHLPCAATLESLVGPRTRGILLCNPCNPTGTVYTEKELDTVADLCRRRDLIWVCDEVYREFVYDGDPVRSVLAYEDLADRVVVVDSVSKRFSACGIRVGCLVSRNAGITAAALKLGQSRLSPPLLGQMAVRSITNLPAGYIDGVIREYRSRRDRLFDCLEKIDGAFAIKPRGALYAMVTLPVQDANHFAAWMLSDFEDDGQTVMVAPGEGFYLTEGAGQREVRIAYVLSAEKMERALVVLQRGLQAYPGPR